MQLLSGELCLSWLPASAVLSCGCRALGQNGAWLQLHSPQRRDAAGTGLDVQDVTVPKALAFAQVGNGQLLPGLVGWMGPHLHSACSKVWRLRALKQSCNFQCNPQKKVAMKKAMIPSRPQGRGPTLCSRAKSFDCSVLLPSCKALGRGFWAKGPC